MLQESYRLFSWEFSAPFKLVCSLTLNDVACCTLVCVRDSPYVTLHKFPGEKSLRAKWVAAARCADRYPWEHSRLCSAHHEEECYELSVRLAGFRRTTGERLRARQRMPDAVPTIFDHSCEALLDERSAFAKEKKKGKEVTAHKLMKCAAVTAIGFHKCDSQLSYKISNSTALGVCVDEDTC